MKNKNKSIFIKVEDSSFDPVTAFSKEGPFIYDRDCQHIIDNLNRDTEITTDELNHALDIVTAYFVEHCINGLVLDINKRNKMLAPAKEMTIDEIEKELGYKIKIVKENKNE
mgnify:CR=1 FL=1